MAKETKKPKSLRVGTVMKGKKGPFVVFGSTKNKDPKYNLNVEITVTNDDGEVLANTTNGILSSFDPRKSPKAEGRNIPANIISELVLFLE